MAELAARPLRKSLTAWFSEVGLTPDKHVISYDDEGGGWAGRLIWTLDVLGHRNYSYLNGGIHSWLAAGLPTAQGMGRGNLGHYTAKLHPQPIAEVDREVDLASNAHHFVGTEDVHAAGADIEDVGSGEDQDDLQRGRGETDGGDGLEDGPEVAGMGLSARRS